MREVESSAAVAWDQPEPNPDWHAEIQAIFNYWRAMNPAGGLPGRQHLVPADIVKLLPGVWLLDVQAVPFRLRYRLVGTRVVQGIGREVTGRWLDEAHPDIAVNPSYLERYRRVFETRIPSWRRGMPHLAIHLDFETIENLFLPMASDGEHVDLLLAMTVFHRSARGAS